MYIEEMYYAYMVEIDQEITEEYDGHSDSTLMICPHKVYQIHWVLIYRFS